MVTIAHLSDPHVGPLPATRARDLLSKRVLGFLSWKFKRRAIHLTEVLAALVADLCARSPDHTVVTGDLTNIALPEEFVRVAQWLEILGPPDQVSIIPGNHDAYVSVPWAQSLGLWSRYMSSDGAEQCSSQDDFPFVRVRDGVAIVGVSTALPMRPLLATGAVGEAQLARLERKLRDLAERHLLRIVLIHHPPTRRATAARKRLVDAARVREIVERAGAELVLHGHTHRSSLTSLESALGPIPVVGAPSASASREAGEYYARYHLYRIDTAAARPRISVEVRGLDAHSLAFTTERHFDLHVPWPDPRAHASA